MAKTGDKRLGGKVALVTGASRGIGKAIALLFANEGANVVVNYFNSAGEAEKVVDKIKAAGVNNSLSVKCDVSQESQVQEMIKTVVSTFGHLDILVNNAGIVFDKPYTERTLEEWNRTLAVNLTGVFLCSKHSAPHLLKSGGVIVNISSNNAFGAYSHTSMDYDASKAGIITLTKDFAQALAPKVRVNAIAPGWVKTEINKDLPADYVKSETERTWLKRFADPEEIAKVASFLASDDASFVTGTTLLADGGYI